VYVFVSPLATAGTADAVIRKMRSNGTVRFLSFVDIFDNIVCIESLLVICVKSYELICIIILYKASPNCKLHISVSVVTVIFSLPQLIKIALFL
jgi:hypothetical protein